MSEANPSTDSSPAHLMRPLGLLLHAEHFKLLYIPVFVLTDFSFSFSDQ